MKPTLSDLNQYTLLIEHLSLNDAGPYTCYGHDPGDDHYQIFYSTSWIYLKGQTNC